MPVGYHHFYAHSCTCADRRDRRGDYFIGGFVGDPFNNKAFAAKLNRIQQKLQKKFGIGNYSSYWSATENKPYKPRSQEQRYKTALVKATNKHDKKVQAILQQNLLFGETFIAEEETQFLQKQGELKKRYNQIK